MPISQSDLSDSGWEGLCTANLLEGALFCECRTFRSGAGEFLGLFSLPHESCRYLYCLQAAHPGCGCAWFYSPGQSVSKGSLRCRLSRVTAELGTPTLSQLSVVESSSVSRRTHPFCKCVNIAGCLGSADRIALLLCVACFLVSVCVPSSCRASALYAVCHRNTWGCETCGVRAGLSRCCMYLLSTHAFG